MRQSSADPPPFTSRAAFAREHGYYLLIAAAVAAAAATLAQAPLASVTLLGAAVSASTLWALLALSSALGGRQKSRAAKAALATVELDPVPSALSDPAGHVLASNAAARARSGEDRPSLLALLAPRMANPADLLLRLRDAALARGSAREDVVTPQGHLRIGAHRVGRLGLLWRLEDLAEAQARQGADAMPLPMVRATPGGTVLYMNDALGRLIGARPSTLDRIFVELPVRSGRPNWINAAAGPVRAVACEVEPGPGVREVYVLPGAAEPEDADARSWAFFADLPVPLLKIAPNGRILLANKLSREMLHHDMSGAIRLADLVEGLGRSVADWLAEAADGRGLGHPEVLKARRAPADVYLQITLSRVLAAEGPILVAVLTDATELKTLEAQFVQSQKMQAIGQLAGGVAHDFNNLLTAISGHCDLMLLRHDRGDQDYGDLIQIAQNANRAASLVGQLLAFSRKQTLQPETLDLRDTLAELVHLLNRLVGERVTLSLVHAPDLSPIQADKRQLEQVLMNLVVNGRDALPDGGPIQIVTANERLDVPVRRDRAEVPAGDYVVVKVIDAGIGIPSDDLDKIFEPFFTTKRVGEGTGLGLSTVYGIVKQTGGYIFVDSVVGEGTTFTIMLPASRHPLPPPVPAASASETQRGSGEEGVILLVEDEAPVRAFASRALRLRGHTVIEAESAEEALRLLADRELDIDLFVTDVIMPGMDGPSWVRRALQDRPDTKAIFVSGYAEDVLNGSSADIPGAVFLPKPFSLNDLAAVVRRQLAQ